MPGGSSPGRASAAGCTPRMRRSPPTYGRSSRPRAARIPSRTWNPGRPWRRPRLSPGPSCWPDARSKLMIFHVSSAEGVELIRWGKSAGVDVMGETAPHYLIFEAEDMVRMGLGSLLKINPPVRSREHAEALWRGLLDGTLEVMGTDHSPHTPEEKMAESPLSDIWKAAPGWPGVETAVPLMLTQVNAGRISLNHYVKVQAEGPARAWNLWPRKGHLGRGADADMTIVDMAREGTIDQR